MFDLENRHFWLSFGLVLAACGSYLLPYRDVGPEPLPQPNFLQWICFMNVPPPVPEPIGFKQFTVEPNTTTEVMVVTTKIPVTTTEVLVTTTEIPFTTTKVPVTTTQILVTASQMPVTTTEVPVTTTEVLVTTTEIPVTTTQIPVTTTEVPVTTTEVLVTTAEILVTSTEVLVTTTETPLTPTEIAEFPTPLGLKQVKEEPETTSEIPEAPTSTESNQATEEPETTPETLEIDTEVYGPIVMEYTAKDSQGIPPIPIRSYGGEYTLVDYDLRISAKVGTSYSGTLKLDIKIKHDTTSVTLLADKRLEFTTNRFTVKKNVAWEKMKAYIHTSDLHPNDKVVSLVVDEGAGWFFNGTTYTIKIHFTSALSEDKQSGFYKSGYREDIDRIPRVYAITAFGNTNRNPILSIYDTSLRHPNEASVSITAGGHYKVLSSPAIMLQHEEERSMVNETIPPSMYSFFVHRFHAIQAQPTTYTVYIPDKFRQDMSSFMALDAGYLISTNLRKYFIPIPDDFPITGVILPNLEPNVVDVWGIIYYQGGAIIDGVRLYDLVLLESAVVQGIFEFSANFKPSATAVLRALLVVAKSNIEQCLGYEWFLTKMEQRYEELSTQSALLELIAYKQVEQIYSNYHSMDMMYLDYVQPFLWRHVYGLGQFDTSPNEEIYFKNLRLVTLFRMAHDYFQAAATYQNFEEFLKKVFANFRGKITSHGEIFDSMQEQLNLYFNGRSFDVNQWLTTFDEYPVLWMYVKDNRIIHFIAKRHDGTYTGNEWNIPIVFQYCQELTNGDNTTGGEVTVNTHIITSTYEYSANYSKLYWILANPGQSVMYRVHYADHGWAALAAKLRGSNFGGLHQINRAQLIDDSMTLFIQNYHKIPQIPFDVVKYLVNETELLPWAVASRHFKFLYQKTKLLEIGSTYQTFVAKLVKPLYNRLGTLDKGSKEHITTKKLRSIAIDLACMVGYEKCINRVNTIVGQAIKNPYKLLESNTRDAVCCAALRAGSTTLLKSILSRISTNSENLEWDKIEIDLQLTQDSDELSFYVRCITCNSVLEFLPLYAKIFFELDKGVYKLPLQEHFRENVQFTNYQLMHAYKQLHESDYVMEQRSLIRWFVIAADQVHNEHESRIIGQTLSNIFSRTLGPYYSSFKRERIEKAPQFPAPMRDRLNARSKEMFKILSYFDNEFRDYLQEFVGGTKKVEFPIKV